MRCDLILERLHQAVDLSRFDGFREDAQAVRAHPFDGLLLGQADARQPGVVRGQAAERAVPGRTHVDLCGMG